MASNSARSHELCQKAEDFSLVNGVNYRIGRENTGDQDAGTMRLQAFRFSEQLSAKHARHLLVADYDCERSSVQELQRTLCRGRADHAITFALELFGK